MALRERIKTIELQAERIQEETLESLSPSTPEQPLALASQIAAAAENVYRYLQAAKIVTDGRVMTQLGILLVAAMDGASDAMVEDALQGIRD